MRQFQSVIILWFLTIMQCSFIFLRILVAADMNNERLFFSDVRSAIEFCIFQDLIDGIDRIRLTASHCPYCLLFVIRLFTYYTAYKVHMLLQQWFDR